MFTAGSHCTHIIEPTDCTLCYLTYYWIYEYNKNNSTKSPATEAGKAKESGLMSTVRTVYEVVCAQISALLQSERRRCQDYSAYVAAIIITLVLAVPECCNISNNSTKLLSVKHTYIYCTCVLHGQHVSTYHKVIFRPYIQIQILGYCVMGSHTLTYCGWVYIMIN
jgi:hypothetical protein